MSDAAIGALIGGITWYLADQIVPTCALVVVLVSIGALSGRVTSAWPHHTAQLAPHVFLAAELD